jgi:HK97 family phage prohead protease
MPHPLVLDPKRETFQVKTLTQTRFWAAGENGAPEDLAPGEYIALASVFGNIDSYGDTIVEGAFTDTLAAWANKGDPLPVIWQHNWADPNAHIGAAAWARQTDGGLLYKGVLDIDDNPMAAQVYRLMKSRRVTQQSFGFDVIDAEWQMLDGVDVFAIKKVDLYEVGPCLVGVNQATDLLDIKSRGEGSLGRKAGETSEPHRGRDAPAADEKASAPAPGSTPDSSASETGMDPASLRLITDIYELD